MRILSLILVLLTFLGEASAQDPQKQESVIVKPLKSESVKGDRLAALNKILENTFSKLSSFKVRSMSDLEAELDNEQLKDMIGCDSVRCAAEIGAAYDARYLLIGSIQILGAKLLLSINLIDTKERNTKRGQTTVNNSEELYFVVVEKAVREVLELPKLPTVNQQAEVSSEKTKAIIRSQKATEQPASLSHQACNLTQEEIMSTIRRHVGKINRCIEAEQKRETNAHLPSTLNLAFVVQATGKVDQLEIGTPYYRNSLLKTCLTETFQSAQFPRRSESTCPVTLPIKTKEANSNPPRATLSKQDIVDGVRVNAKNVMSCLNKARGMGEISPGTHKLTLDWTIRADGSVTEAKLKGPESFLRTSLSGCLETKMRKWKFPASKQGAPIRNYPFGPFTVR